MEHISVKMNKLQLLNKKDEFHEHNIVSEKRKLDDNTVIPFFTLKERY